MSRWFPTTGNKAVQRIHSWKQRRCGISVALSVFLELRNCAHPVCKELDFSSSKKSNIEQLNALDSCFRPPPDEGTPHDASRCGCPGDALLLHQCTALPPGHPPHQVLDHSHRPVGQHRKRSCRTRTHAQSVSHEGWHAWCNAHLVKRELL